MPQRLNTEVNASALKDGIASASDLGRRIQKHSTHRVEAVEDTDLASSSRAVKRQQNNRFCKINCADSRTPINSLIIVSTEV